MWWIQGDRRTQSFITTVLRARLEEGQESDMIRFLSLCSRCEHAVLSCLTSLVGECWVFNVPFQFCWLWKLILNGLPPLTLYPVPFFTVMPETRSGCVWSRLVLWSQSHSDHQRAAAVPAVSTDRWQVNKLYLETSQWEHMHISLNKHGNRGRSHEMSCFRKTSTHGS